MFPELVIFNISISMYPLCVAIGFLFGMIVADLVSSRFLVSKNESYILMCLIEIGVVIGGKVLYLLINIKQISKYYNSFGLIGLFTKTGFVFYGGLFGGLTAIKLFAMAIKKSFFRCSSLAFSVTPLIHAFGRLGCFCAGCCYGKVWSGKLTVCYKNEYRFPVQLLESSLNFLLFILFIILIYKNKTYFICSLYMFFYGIIRSICEFFRGDISRGFMGTISISTWISILCILIGIFVFLLLKKKDKNEQPY